MPEKSMFYGASPVIFELARKLRENMTSQEKMLWERIKSNQVAGLRFKAQHPIAKYIADFYCHKIKLVIEIDGSNHSETDQAEYDLGRTSDLEEFGITVLRFSNEKIEMNLDDVIYQINIFCLMRLKDSSPQDNFDPDPKG